MSSYDEFQDRMTTTNATLAASAQVASALTGEIRNLNAAVSATGSGVGKLEGALSRGLSKTIDSIVLDGIKMSDALTHVRESLVDAAWKAAKQPVVDHASSLLSGFIGKILGPVSPFADGAGFAQGRVMPFASGGVVSGPVSFPMRGGTGLMGEAGPEAIMPLSRGADGRLGVRASGAGQPVQVVMNIQTPDVQGFQRSRSQIAAQMARAISAGTRNR